MHRLRSSPRAALATLGAVTLLALPAFAGPTDDTTPVPAANTRVAGMNRPNTLTQRLVGRHVEQVIAAQGSMPCENPLPTKDGFTTSNYGYLSDGLMMPVPGALPIVEASKTEPDKNTYLVLKGQHGFDAAYDYGTHFVYQGHELGRSGYITRVNLDADGAHRVTALASKDTSGAFLPVFDGSVWYPFSRVLLFSWEGNATTGGGLWQATPDYPSTVTDMTGIMGRGGFEGIQADDLGNLYIVEDIGGPNGSNIPNDAVTNPLRNPLGFARQPNSFVYRFVPKNTSDLTAGGRLQVLQVMSKAHAGPITFGGTTQALIDADITSTDVLDLHTYGNTFTCNWVQIHDTAVDGFTSFDANAAAKAAKGTPFKRPENGMFRPGGGFREFFFTETGDTNLNTQAGSTRGGFGALFNLTRKKNTDSWTLSLFFQGDSVHTGLDNLSFLTRDLLISAEDAGDTLHGQRNALDSLWMFDVTANYGAAVPPAPVRVLAEGRDSAATTDAAIGALPAASHPGFQNDGDNEITGTHVSDGNPTVAGLLGTERPFPFRDGWRIFWSQQHGDNILWEIIERCDGNEDSRGGNDDHGHDDGHGHDQD